MSSYDDRYDNNGETYKGGGDDQGGGSSPYDAFEDRDSNQKHSSRGFDNERSRMKPRERDREKDQDRYHRDYKDRSSREGRGGGRRDDYDRHRGRDYERNRGYDRDRRHKHRSRSRSKDKSRNRSRSRSRSRSKSKRASGFDMAPPGTPLAPGAPNAGMSATFALTCWLPLLQPTRTLFFIHNLLHFLAMVNMGSIHLYTKFIILVIICRLWFIYSFEDYLLSAFIWKLSTVVLLLAVVCGFVLFLCCHLVMKAILGYLSTVLHMGVATVEFMVNEEPGQRFAGSCSPSADMCCHFGQLPGAPQAMPGMFPSMFPFGSTQFGALPLMPAQAMTQQATRHARRVYVGGLPPMANEQTIATFFSRVMSAIGGNSAGAGDAVVNVYINHEKKFAFVEMRSVEEASNAMALDGIIFEGVSVRVRRPTDYNPSLAAALGPSQPSPCLNLAAVGLTPGAIGGVEGPDRIFVGGLPYYFSEAQIRELLESFGSLRGFDLVKDRDTGNSKGYGFCVYQDPAVTDIACAALNGLKMGDKTLTVRRATASSGQTKDQETILQQAQQHIAMQKMVWQASGANLPGVGMANAAFEVPTKVICLSEVVTADELRNDDDYNDILEDMREEGGKFGCLVNVVIPRPTENEEQIPGIGKVFLEYSDTLGSARAKAALHGRKFGDNEVIAVFYSEDQYFNSDYGA